MKKISPTNNFTYLTLALLAFLLAAGAVQSLPAGYSRYTLDAFIVVIFLVAVKSLNLGAFWSHFAWSVTLVLLVAIFLHAVFRWKETDYIELALMLVLFVAITMRALRQVLLEGHIDRNKIMGSVALYILIGLTWAVLYLLMIEINPNALNGMDGLPWDQNFSQAAYFSFVTLTTLGYGDISPAHRFVEVLVYIEAIVGAFYMAVFVAGLISAAKPRSLRNSGQ